MPALEKIVSIFEEHTDIIRKDRRATLYGHKICLTGGASSMILDCTVLQGNPADSTLAKKMVDRQADIFARPPRQVVFDGAFASKLNLQDIKAAGVKDVAFSKSEGMEITAMVKSSWVYKRLRDFRAGIEGNICRRRGRRALPDRVVGSAASGSGPARPGQPTPTGT